jgi:hypothetical protein
MPKRKLTFRFHVRLDSAASFLKVFDRRTWCRAYRFFSVALAAQTRSGGELLLIARACRVVAWPTYQYRILGRAEGEPLGRVATGGWPTRLFRSYLFP